MPDTLTLLDQDDHYVSSSITDQSENFPDLSHLLPLIRGIYERVGTIAQAQGWNASMLSTNQMATLLEMSPETLKKAAANGEIPGHKIAGRGKRGSWYFIPKEVVDAIQNQGQERVDYRKVADKILSSLSN